MNNLNRIWLNFCLTMAFAGCCYGQSAPWSVTPTGSNHSIFFNTTVIPSFNGIPLENGDAIALFYDSLGFKACGGITEWLGAGTSITVYGASSPFPGFAASETFRFKIWKKSTNCIIDSVSVGFTPIDGGLITAVNQFMDGGMSEINFINGQQNSVAYSKSAFCKNDPDPVPDLIGKPANLKFTAPAGIVVHSVTGVIDLTKSQPGNYHINFITSSCLSTTGTDITVFADNRPQITGDTVICGNGQAILNTSLMGYNYLWSSGQTTRQITVNQSGAYWLRVTDTNNCIAFGSLYVDGQAPPVVNLGPDTTLCEGESLVVDAGNTGSKIRWNTEDTSQTITANSPGTYSVTVTGTMNCLTTKSLTINYLKAPIPKLRNDTLVCKGTSVLLEAGNNWRSYNWSNGSDKNYITTDQPGNYWVKVTDTNGCTGSDTVSIANDNFDASGYGIEIIHPGCQAKGKIQVLHNGIPATGNYNFELYDLENTLTATSSKGQFSPVDGVYSVIVKNLNGCSAILPDRIELSRSANCKDAILAPDASGQLGSVFISFPGYVKIFDRTGRIVRKLQVPAHWNGSDESGNIVPMGDYYIVDENGNKLIITVIR